MAFDTGKINPTPSIQTRGQTSGRIIKENEEIRNFADWLEEITTPGSGLSINTEDSGSTSFSEVPAFENGRLLFESGFETGLDTLNRFHLVYNGAAVLPGAPHSNGVGGIGFIGPADLEQGCVPLQVEFDGVTSNQWTLQSQTTMKLGNNEVGYHCFSGVFLSKDLGVSTNVIEVVSRISGVDNFGNTQPFWNLDKLDGSGPSGITIDFTKINVCVIRVPHKDQGNVKFGFYINNKIVYAHELIKQNTSETPFAISDRPLRCEGDLDSVAGPHVEDTSKVRVGCFDDNGGYFFSFGQTQAAGFNTDVKLYSISSYAIGANRNNYYRTFSKGNEINTKSVTNVRIPLVSLKPKQFFPPPIAPSVTNIRNRVIVALKEINVSGASQNFDDGVFIEVIFNQDATLLTGATFSLNNPNSSVDIDTAATAISAGGDQLYAKTIYPTRADVVIDIEKVLSNFVNKYSCSSISALNIGTVLIDPTISIVATSLSVNVVETTATFVWVEKP